MTHTPYTKQDVWVFRLVALQAILLLCLTIRDTVHALTYMATHDDLRFELYFAMYLTMIIYWLLQVGKVHNAKMEAGRKAAQRDKCGE